MLWGESGGGVGIQEAGGGEVDIVNFSIIRSGRDLVEYSSIRLGIHVFIHEEVTGVDIDLIGK